MRFGLEVREEIGIDEYGDLISANGFEFCISPVLKKRLEYIHDSGKNLEACLPIELLNLKGIGTFIFKKM
jgi:hypothetical protein